MTHKRHHYKTIVQQEKQYRSLYGIVLHTCCVLHYACVLCCNICCYCCFFFFSSSFKSFDNTTTITIMHTNALLYCVYSLLLTKTLFLLTNYEKKRETIKCCILLGCIRLCKAIVALICLH